MQAAKLRRRRGLLRRPMHSWRGAYLSPPLPTPPHPSSSPPVPPNRRGAPRVRVPPIDEDEFPEPLLALRATQLSNAYLHLLPITDDFSPFAPGEDPEAYLPFLEPFLDTSWNLPVGEDPEAYLPLLDPLLDLSWNLPVGEDPEAHLPFLEPFLDLSKNLPVGEDPEAYVLPRHFLDTS